MRKYTRAEGSASADDVCGGQRIAARGADVKSVSVCGGACMEARGRMCINIQDV